MRVWIFLLALAVHTASAWFIQRPGYMDAYYYFGGAKRLAQGYGFTEPYLWNYLDDPAGLPHPSHLYWMPLTSILAAGPMLLCGRLCPDNSSLFRAAQIPSVLLASLLPVITYAISLSGRMLKEHDRTSLLRPPPSALHALSAASFCLFPLFYFIFWPTTDAFALYGVVGSTALLCAGRGLERGAARWFFFAGLLAGLGHLARADGMLLLLVVLWISLREGRSDRTDYRPHAASFLALAGYLLVTFAWFLRNLVVTGSFLAPGGSQALWFTSYNDLFNYPAELSPATYLAAGWGTILRGKWEAVVTNLQTAIAVHGLIALAPFIVVGLWQLRREPLFRPAILYALALYFAMTFVFTFPGARGGLFHSGAALLPFYFAAAPIGLERVVHWMARRRPNWHAPTATRVFLIGLAMLGAAMTLFLFDSRVIGMAPEQPAWNKSDWVYEEIGGWLASVGASPSSVVVVNNPPAFYYFTDHPAVVIPNGDLGTLLAVADRYDARWVVVDANVPDGLLGFYLGGETTDRLKLAAEFEDGEGSKVRVYEVER